MKVSFARSRPVLLALALGLVPGTVIALTTNDVGPRAGRSDPAASLSEAEQIQSHERGWAEFQARYEKWLSDTLANRKDFSGVLRVELNALVGNPPTSLDEAVALADEIVVARVEGVDFLAEAVTVVHLQVVEVAKGSPPQHIDIVQAGGPMPAHEDWTGIVLAQVGADPLLLPQDSALLLIDSTDGRRAIVPFVGQFRIVNGMLAPTSVASLGEALRGLSVEAAIARLGLVASPRE